jgi:hypothetical protein
MKKIGFIISILGLLMTSIAQEENPLRIYGNLITNQRAVFLDETEWGWNENRLTLKFEKRTERTKFYSEVWLRNFGIPNYTSSDNLFNQGIIDPFNIQLREAYFQISDFLIPNLDLKIGRQRITWGTADKLNPTDNLNPYDMEDILDFGRHRGSDAINLTYYFKSDYSLQAVVIPFFQPANLPVGMFSNALMPSIEIPSGITLNSLTTQINKPDNTLFKSTTLGFKFKGSVKSVDFSLSYVWGYNGIPFLTKTTVTPKLIPYGIDVIAELSYVRNHIFGIDISTDIKGVGVWAEGALFKLTDDLYYTSIVHNIIPIFEPTQTDSLLLNAKKPYFRAIVGADYHFGKGSYINVQYMHGFIHECGNQNMSDYLFLRFDQRLFDDKITFSPISGAFIINKWTKISDNYSFAYIPQIVYNPVPDFELSLSAVLIKGKGNGIFAALQDYDQIILKGTYSF